MLHGCPELKMLKLYYVGLAASLVLTCLFQRGYCQSGEPCPSVINEPSCVCNHPSGHGIIDATSLAKQGAEAPMWEGLLDRLEYKYSFNPCYPYSQALCANVHVSLY